MPFIRHPSLPPKNATPRGMKPARPSPLPRGDGALTLTGWQRWVYIHVMAARSGDLAGGSAQVMASCACEGLRRAARAVTGYYEDALAPSGLRVTQLPILVGLSVAGPLPMTPLAKALGIDRTTLARNVRALEERHLVAVESGDGDRRRRVLSLTPAGEQALSRTLELWGPTQAAVEERFGRERLQVLLGELSALTALVRGGAS